jgi:hypothetical protein
MVRQIPPGKAFRAAFLFPAIEPEPLPAMHALTILWQTIIGLVKQVWLLPHNASLAVRRYRAQGGRAEAEAERLDRIRNPSKYLGK